MRFTNPALSVVQSSPTSLGETELTQDVTE